MKKPLDWRMTNFDIEKIGRMIDNIERYLNDLKEMNIKEERDLTCKERFYEGKKQKFQEITA